MSKVFPCKACNCIGTEEKLITRQLKCDDVIVSLIEEIPCSICKGEKYILVDPLTFYLEYNRLRSDLINLKQNHEIYKKYHYTDCIHCDGSGVIDREEFWQGGYKIVNEFLCSICHGDGRYIDHEQTDADTQSAIDDISKQLTFLQEIQREDKTNLKDYSIDRSATQTVADTNRNICYNCSNYISDKGTMFSCNPYCDRCHYKDMSVEKVLFNPICKSSNIWYNRFVKNK